MPSTVARISIQRRLRSVATASDKDVSPTSEPMPGRCGSNAPAAGGNCVFCGPIPLSLLDPPPCEEGDSRPWPALGILAYAENPLDCKHYLKRLCSTWILRSE